MVIANQEQANAEIDRLIKEAYAALSAAEEIADRWKLEFSFGPAYGMGGTYYGDPEDRDSWNPEQGWVSSSADC